jgi:hypothetical protein
MTHTGKNRFSTGKLKLIRGLLVGGLIGVGVAFRILGAGESDQDRTFKLREVSVFDQSKESFMQGQICVCRNKPFREVKNYPDFASQAPIFGAIRFGARAYQPDSGLLYYFAVDESRGTGKGYDRLYFDGNRDLDLRNDPVAKLQPYPPDHGYAPRFAGIKAKAAFDFLKVNLGANDGNPNLVEIMPRLLLAGSDKATFRYMFFVRTHIFEGDIQIGSEKFHAQLGNDYTITPSLDAPGTALVLSQGNNNAFNWSGGDRLSAMHKVDGQFFSFSATQAGELTVHPYQGDLGTFEIGPVGRQLANLGMSGSLQARDWAVPVGGESRGSRSAEVGSCQVPVGDYQPEYLTVRFGRLTVGVSQNNYSEAKQGSRAVRPDVFGITIRKDRPFTLDFSNKPEVMFVSPAPNRRVKPGDTLMITAALVDPKLDIMIRRLEDTSRKKTKDANGRPLRYEQNLSLDPTVMITRADGEKVAEGVMPFG